MAIPPNLQVKAVRGKGDFINSRRFLFTGASFLCHDRDRDLGSKNIAQPPSRRFRVAVQVSESSPCDTDQISRDGGAYVWACVCFEKEGSWYPRTSH
jgi:hypothetical protein